MSQIDATTYRATGTGNNGVASGALTLVDAFGNPATAVGAGWTLTLGATSDRPGDVGAFKVGTINGANGQPLTVNFPSSGPAALAVTYTHNGNPDWADVLTLTAAKNGVAVSPCRRASRSTSTRPAPDAKPHGLSSGRRSSSLSKAHHR